MDRISRAAQRRSGENRQLKRREREVLRAGDLNDADLAAIAATEMDRRHADLDKEL